MLLLAYCFDVDCFDVGRFKFLFKFQDGDFVLVVF